MQRAVPQLRNVGVALCDVGVQSCKRCSSVHTSAIPIAAACPDCCRQQNIQVEVQRQSAPAWLCKGTDAEWPPSRDSPRPASPRGTPPRPRPPPMLPCCQNISQTVSQACWEQRHCGEVQKLHPAVAGRDTRNACGAHQVHSCIVPHATLATRQPAGSKHRVQLQQCHG